MIELDRPESSNDLVNEIFEKIQRGLNRRDREEKRWKYNEKFEDLYQWGGESPARGEGDEITVNKIGSFVRDYRAEVCYNDPRVKYTPKHPSGWEPIVLPVMGPDGKPKIGPNGQPEVRKIVKAKAREALVNSILSAPEQNLQQTSGLFTKSGVVAYGSAKVAYEPIYRTQPQPDKEQYIPRGKDGKLDFEKFAKNPEDGTLVEGDDKPLVEVDDIPIWEQFTLKWVSYKNLIIDPDGGPYWDDHSWICEEEIRSFDDVKDDPLYKNTKDLKSSGRRASKFPEDRSDPLGSRYSRGDSGEETEEEFSRLFHFFDLDEEKYYVLSDGCEEFLREETWQDMGIVDHPYEDFRPTLGTDGEWYQRPLVCDLIPPAHGINVLYQMLIRAAQNSTRKVFIEEGSIDEDELAKLMSTEDLATIKVKIKRGENIANKVLPYIPPNPSASIVQSIAMLEKEFDELGGMTGEIAKSDSATEANILESYNKGRIGHDRKILSESWRRLLKKFDDLIDRHMTQKRAVQIQGEDGLLFTAIIDPAQIKGDYDVDVDFQDLAPPNTAAQAAAKMQLLRIFAESPRMAEDEAVVRELCEPHGIKSENFIKGIVRRAQEEIAFQRQMAMMQAQMKQQASMKQPTATPTSEGQALAQMGGGQIPRGQRPE